MPFAELRALLQEERRCLRAGDLRGLAALGTRKARLGATLAALPPDRTDPAVIAALRAEANRNDRLLGAALSGLRAALGKLDAARRGGPGLDTYNQGGEKQTLGAPLRRLERKA